MGNPPDTKHRVLLRGPQAASIYLSVAGDTQRRQSGASNLLSSPSMSGKRGWLGMWSCDPFVAGRVLPESVQQCWVNIH